MLLGALLGCGGNNNVTNPAFQPEIANNPDSFQFQATNVQNVSQVVEYTWQNTGTEANIDQSCAVTQGTVALVLFDASGTQVYAKGLQESGSFASAAGTPGDWKIRVHLSDTDGTLNFRVQKRT